MINLEKISEKEPYKVFLDYHNAAKLNGQKNVEAISISSFNFENNQVESRYVNLKYIIDEEWIFFSNYNSKKASDFSSHDQISVLFYWDLLNVQIRIKAHIKKTDSAFSDLHYSKRNMSKNAIAVSSKQSKQIDSYDEVVSNYQSALNNKDVLKKRPHYWGGYSFTPFYFEFWEGHEFRLNKRNIFHISDNEWKSFIIQP
tara:strand:- start:1403 stop:2002 length:600 start_codon:yes stop_codon:yes gene_type:complete